MDGMFALDVCLRILHILAAITAVGGTIFARLALVPAVEEAIPNANRAAFHAAIRRRWSRLVAMSIGCLLVSGLVNFLVRIYPNYDVAKFYHPLFGVKFLLALAIFFIASVISGRSAMADRFRANLKFWLTVNLALALAVVIISAVLKTAPKTPKPAQSAATTLTTAGTYLS